METNVKLEYNGRWYAVIIVEPTLDGETRILIALTAFIADAKAIAEKETSDAWKIEIRYAEITGEGVKLEDELTPHVLNV